MSNQIPAIPTKYGGTQFRSRLEARWAAFFDLLGWSWEYEPLDLAGYIPDFIVNNASVVYAQAKSPLLIEVKPLIDSSGFSEPARKIKESGWVGDCAIVGALHINGFAGRVFRGMNMPPAPDGKVWTRPYGAEGVMPIGCPDFGDDDNCCQGSGGDSFCGSFYGSEIIDGRMATDCASGTGRGGQWRWFGVDRSKNVDTLRPSHPSIATLWREAGNRAQWRAPEAG